MAVGYLVIQNAWQWTWLEAVLLFYYLLLNAINSVFGLEFEFLPRTVLFRLRFFYLFTWGTLIFIACARAHLFSVFIRHSQLCVRILRNHILRPSCQYSWAYILTAVLSIPGALTIDLISMVLWDKIWQDGWS